MLAEISNGAAAVEDKWCFLKKLNIVMTQPSNPIPRYMPTNNENTCSYNKNLNMNVYSSFIPNTRNVDATQM